jgi:hypothetical protein
MRTHTHTNTCVTNRCSRNEHPRADFQGSLSYRMPTPRGLHDSTRNHKNTKKNIAWCCIFVKRNTNIQTTVRRVFLFNFSLSLSLSLWHENPGCVLLDRRSKAHSVAKDTLLPQRLSQSESKDLLSRPLSGSRTNDQCTTQTHTFTFLTCTRQSWNLNRMFLS